MTRNVNDYDYMNLPFPRINGKPHPAYLEIQRQARLISLMSFGLKKGGGPYGAALLIDRDMKQRPWVYEELALPPAGLWFPSSLDSTGLQIARPKPTVESDEERAKDVARRSASKWRTRG